MLKTELEAASKEVERWPRGMRRQREQPTWEVFVWRLIGDTVEVKADNRVQAMLEAGKEAGVSRVGDAMLKEET